jgi:hypothetical protein
MSVSPIADEIIREVNGLPPELQRRVLGYARSLVLSRPRGTPGRKLLPLAGTLPPEDAQEMIEAIEAGCEQVDESEW